jgi:hypothetical protein
LDLAAGNKDTCVLEVQGFIISTFMYQETDGIWDYKLMVTQQAVVIRFEVHYCIVEFSGMNLIKIKSSTYIFHQYSE